MKEIKINFQGPFKLLSKDSESVFSHKLSFNKGLYMFVFPGTNNKKSVHYVGMTNKGFSYRLAQHLEYYLTGRYYIFNPKFFVDGKEPCREAGWGWYNKKRDGKSKEEGLKEYIQNCEKLSLKMLNFLDVMQIYLAPFEEDSVPKEFSGTTLSRFLERMEAEIALDLKSNQPAPIKDFQDDGVIYRPTREGEKDFSFTITNYSLFSGMKKSLTAKFIPGRKSKLGLEYNTKITKFKNFLSGEKWTFAKTMPEIPHHYIVKEKLSKEDQKLYDEFYYYVKKNGYSEEFYGKEYRYYDLDGYKYWFIENILNREKI